ncbi:MAG: hypothetical protein LBE21_06250 [Pseudomonadales bacterium]|jgi:hypothetical protein|nr:hypothetical protein [Pseudomonadales bacterium]
MSTIFKKPSQPKKHQIIRDEYEFQLRNRSSWRKTVLWLCLLALLIWLGVALARYVMSVS